VILNGCQFGDESGVSGKVLLGLRFLVFLSLLEGGTVSWSMGGGGQVGGWAQWEWCVCWFILFAGRGRCVKFVGDQAGTHSLSFLLASFGYFFFPSVFSVFGLGVVFVEQVVWGILFVCMSSDSLHVVYLLAPFLYFTCFH